MTQSKMLLGNCRLLRTKTDTKGLVQLTTVFIIPRVGNAPINVKPHYPPPGITRGLVGDFGLKFCPTSGVFDRSKF